MMRYYESDLMCPIRVFIGFGRFEVAVVLGG